MGNQSSKSKHKVKISGGGDGQQLESAYSAGAQRPNSSHSPAVAKRALPEGVNLDHRHSLPVHQPIRQPPPPQPQQQQQQQIAQQQARSSNNSPQVAHRQPQLLSPLGLQPPRPQSMAPGLGGGGPPLGASTMSADIQLVLSQLIDRKPKYGLLRQLDFSELDDRARFVLFEAACDLLDQAKTIDSLREERRAMRGNLNAVRRVASIDHLDNSRHRRVASQELASCITQELQRHPPKLVSPAESAAADPEASAGALLGDLVRAWLQLERQFLEHTRQELLLLSRGGRGPFADAVQACRTTHRLLAAMLEAAEGLHRRRLDELVDTVTAPTDARGTQVLRARLKLPTEESRAVRASAGQLLCQASELGQPLPWDSLVDAGQFPAFKQAPSNVAGFLGNCAAWCWRAVCSNPGRLSLDCVEEGAPFRSELHRAELGPGLGRPVACCLWPVLRQSRTVICKALVATGPSLGPVAD